MRVPGELAMVPVGKVDQVTDGDAAGADLDVGDRPLARLDAVHPVLEVARALVVLDLVLVDRLLEDRVGFAYDHHAVDEDLPLLADKRDPVVLADVTRLAVAVFHHALVHDVLVRDEDFVADVGPAVNDLRAVFVALARRRNNLDGPRAVHPQRPLGDVEVVGAPVGDVAAGVFAVIAPAGVERVLVRIAGITTDDVVPRPLGRLAKPYVPFEPFGRRLRRQVAGLAGRADAHPHLLNLPDPAVLDVFARLAERPLRALLAAGLENPIAFADAIDDRLGFVNG